MKPAVIYLVETYLSEKNEISFEGCQCFSLNRATEGGGILVGVNNNLKYVSIK